MSLRRLCTCVCMCVVVCVIVTGINGIKWISCNHGCVHNIKTNRCSDELFSDIRAVPQMVTASLLLAHFTLLDWEAVRINPLAALGAAGRCCGNMSLGACSGVVLGPMGASCSCAMSGVTFVHMEFKCSCCYYLNSYRSALRVCEGAAQLMGFS